MAKEAGYIRVQKNLRRSIIMGEYQIGDMLPSENKLSDTYKLSRMTIRHALKDLESEGLIYRKKGKGSFVGRKRKSIELALVGFSEIMKREGVEVETKRVLEPTMMEWSDDFYWELSKKEKKAGCISFKRIRGIHGRPVMIEHAYLANIGIKNFCTTPFVNGSLFDTLIINHDIELTGVEQKFKAISANKAQANSLNIKEGSPILEIIRKLSTSKPDLYLYSFIYCNTNEFTFG